MIRWVLVIFLGLFLLPLLVPPLQKLGVWRLPGDVRFKVRGLVMCLPFGSTVALSAVVFIVARMFQ